VRKSEKGEEEGEEAWSAHCWVQCYTMKVEKKHGQTGEGCERRVRKSENGKLKGRKPGLRIAGSSTIR
jgi:hypothetical protein